MSVTERATISDAKGTLVVSVQSVAAASFEVLHLLLEKTHP